MNYPYVERWGVLVAIRFLWAIGSSISHEGEAGYKARTNPGWHPRARYLVLALCSMPPPGYFSTCSVGVGNGS